MVGAGLDVLRPAFTNARARDGNCGDSSTSFRGTPKAPMRTKRALADGLGVADQRFRDRRGIPSSAETVEYPRPAVLRSARYASTSLLVASRPTEPTSSPEGTTR